ncbi:hypothetical protein FOCC_FOCC014349, partial [Frankliniella occidentalis]
MMGNCYVYLFGDINQLDPVGDKPLYSFLDGKFLGQCAKGKEVIDSFQHSFHLTEIKRQSDTSFQKLLNNVSDGEVTTDDYSVLETRFSSNVSSEERKKFENAVHLFPTRDEVKLYNEISLGRLKDSNENPVPVLKVPAVHNCPAALKGSVEEANGLEPILYLAEGATIMLRSNLWTKKGLVNGSVGRIVHIIFNEDSNPHEDLPVVIICHFDKYKGPYLNNSSYVPITTVTRSWTNKCGTNCSRIQFPLSLAYACTIHKAQGLSLELVFIQIGDREIGNGSTYTALSRVTSLKGMLLVPFQLKRLTDLNQKFYMVKRKAWLQNRIKVV